MFGTDYPFDIGDPEARRALPALDSIVETERRKILCENAQRVLGMARKPEAANAK
jgi:aminocarboxymuconate-semialdehyde decarboxylase